MSRLALFTYGPPIQRSALFGARQTQQAGFTGADDRVDAPDGRLASLSGGTSVTGA